MFANENTNRLFKMDIGIIVDVKCLLIVDYAKGYIWVKTCTTSLS